MPALVRYLATFGYPSGGVCRWPDWQPGPRFGKTLEFFLEPLRPIFEPSSGGPNSRGVRHLQHPDDPAVEAYLFPGGVGILVIQRSLEAEEPGVALREQAGGKGELWPLVDGLLASLIDGTRREVHEHRLLTWVLWPDGPADRRQERELLFALTEHLPRATPDRLRPAAERGLFRRQGLARWAAWSALFHRDNAAIVFTPIARDTQVPLRILHQESSWRLYLLCLFLKLRLLGLMRSLIPDRPLENLGAMWSLYDRLRSEYLEFRNRFWFAEVTRDTTGRIAYRRVSRSMGLAELMREVSGEIEVLHSQYGRLVAQDEQCHREELQDRINVITWYLFPLAIASGLLGMNVLVPGSRGDFFSGVGWLIGALLFTLLVMVTGLRITQARSRRG